MQTLEPRPRDEIWAERAIYAAELGKYLNTSNLSVGFLFEGIDLTPLGESPEGKRLPRHFAHLMSIDRSGRIWVVIPTRWGGPDR